MTRDNRLMLFCYLIWFALFFLRLKEPITQNLFFLFFMPLIAFAGSFLIIMFSEGIIEKVSDYKLVFYQNSKDDGFMKSIYLSTVIALAFLALEILPYLNVGDVPDDLMY